ncbi:MAG: hypothetical protein NTV97_20490 [Alphaproteobacteria bacterium]|nr:hypothetical protein [Alphaproteobacteria bacterium]
MPAIPVIQPSFAAGELSPFLHGRVDLAKFHIGARTMLNFFVHPHGGASNRPGTRYIGPVGDHVVRHRLIPFQFRASPAGQNYALLFGHQTMQVVMNGGFVLDGGGAVYTLTTPYAAADLATLKFVQSADTMTLTHPSYAPRNLTRTGHAAWTLSTITFTPAMAAPTGLSGTPTSAGATSYLYAVTSINDNSGEESLPATATVASSHVLVTDSAMIDLAWTPAIGATKYNVYRSLNGIYGFIGQGASTFRDNNIAPDVSNTPPQLNNPFATSGNWPACSSYYLQRQVFADTTTKPQTLWFTNVGAFTNMNVSAPTKDSDAITRTLIGRQVNEIRHLVPGQSLLVMTSGAEWRCYPGPSGAALTPAACTTLPQTAFGCSHVPPIQTNNSLLFVQERGSRVRELRFDVLQDQYQSIDMSVLSQHLLYDTGAQHTIQEWAFAEEPFRIVWAVRSDGLLLGFTFMREHEVYAWHRHSTDGVVESVCSIPEADGFGIADAVYLVVARTIGGQTRRYVERMASRAFTTISDAWFVDCGLQYSGAPVTSVSGLSHLEGKTVAILGDGNVVPSQVVTGGAVTLDGAYGKVTVGLPYAADLETLNLELAAEGGTIQGQMKKIAQVTLRVKDARGVAVGLGQGMLQEVKQRSIETLGSAMAAFNGDWQVAIPSDWNRDGRLFVRQAYPLPCSILDLIPEVSVGD